MKIDTPRTCIRPFCPDDLEDLYAIFSDPFVMEYVEPPFTREQTAGFLQDFCIERRGALAVEHRETGCVIGYLLCNDSAEPGAYELGWIFNRAFWRQDYAYETCSALIEHAFTALHARRVWAETADPIKSAGLMRKLGMTPCGRDGELLLYTLSREDFV